MTLLSKEHSPVTSIKDVVADPIIVRPKFTASMEKKIEHLWLESQDRGWRYNDFIVVVLEVLAVLRHRNASQDGKALGEPPSGNES